MVEAKYNFALTIALNGWFALLTVSEAKGDQQVSSKSSKKGNKLSSPVNI